MITDTALCQWYENVLGNVGSTQITAAPEKGRRLARFFTCKDYDEMLAWIRSTNDQGYNMYFTLENYTVFDNTKKTLRTKEAHAEIAGRKCLVLDFDLKDSEFTSIPNLAEYVRDMMEHPPNSYVASGGGVHIYYLLNDYITEEQMIAFRAKYMAIFKGSACEVDKEFKGAHALRSYIRCPNTINWKPKYEPNYPLTKLLSKSTDPYTFEELYGEWKPTRNVDFFGGMQPPNRIIEGLQILPPTNIRSTEVSMKHVREGCAAAELYYTLSQNQFKSSEKLVGNRADLTMFANLCHHTVEEYGEKKGNRKAEFMSTSSNWPDSTEDFLGRQIWDSFMGGPTMRKPWTCGKWGEMASACKTCPHRSKTNFSPWKAGLTAIKPDFTAPSSPVGGGVQVKGYEFTATGVKSKHTGKVFIRPIVKPLFKFDNIEGDRYIMLDVDGERKSVSYKAFSGPASTAATLQNIGITVMTTHEKSAQSYMKTCHELAPFKKVRLSFGWASANEFITPFKIIGSTEKPVFTWRDAENEERYGAGTKGTSAEWCDHMRGFDDDAFLPHQALIMSSFASPLLEVFRRALPVAGFVTNLYSSASGSGKSISLAAAQSVWYDPSDWAVRFSDTQMAQWEQLRIHKNLPVTWDEITVMDPDQMCDSVFYATTGKSRQRLEVQGNKFMSGRFRTMMLTTSNTAISEMLKKSNQGSNEAAYYRVIDLSCERLDPSDPRITGIMQVEQNMAEFYGKIGEDFIQYVIVNKGNLLNHAQHLIGEMKEHDRFVRSWAVAIMVSIKVLTDMNLMPFDAKKLSTFINVMLGNSRQHAADAVSDSSIGPEEFLFKNSKRIIRKLTGNESDVERNMIISVNDENTRHIGNTSANSRMGSAYILLEKDDATGKFNYYIPPSVLTDGIGDDHGQVKKVWKTRGVTYKRKGFPNAGRMRAYHIKSDINFHA